MQRMAVERETEDLISSAEAWTQALLGGTCDVVRARQVLVRAEGAEWVVRVADHGIVMTGDRGIAYVEGDGLRRFVPWANVGWIKED